MTKKHLSLSAISLIILVSISQAQDTTILKHPELNFSYTTIDGNEWQNNPYHQDKMIYEMVNTNREIHVMLWYNGGTEMSCEKYLVKMADMKGLQFDIPVKKDYDGKTIWILECNGSVNDIPVTKILAAMSYEKPYGEDVPERCQGKAYNAMHIAQVWCPEDSYQDNKTYMEDIVASLELEEE